jgi:hypothetical protein
MQSPFANLSPRSKFVLLQIAAVVVGFGLPPLLSMGTVWIWETVFGLAGIALGVVAFARSGRNGLSPQRLVVAGAIVWGVCILCWWAVALVLGGFLSTFLGSDQMDYYVGTQYTQLPIFTAGCLAYLGLGPFGSRVSAAARARQLIVGNRELRLGGPARPDLVDRAERLLGLRLPRSYRDFLLDFGELRSPSVRCLGLGPTTNLECPTSEDFVGATLDARVRLGLPKGYVVCATDVPGHLVCVDTLATRDDEGLVVIWNGEARTVVRVASNSFAEYLVARLGEKSTAASA